MIGNRYDITNFQTGNAVAHVDHTSDRIVSNRKGWLKRCQPAHDVRVHHAGSGCDGFHNHFMIGLNARPFDVAPTQLIDAFKKQAAHYSSPQALAGVRTIGIALSLAFIK